VGFEPTIPVFERVMMVHALYCAATVIGEIEAHAVEQIYYKTVLQIMHFIFNSISKTL
jgi:hypothetical protein